MTRPGPLGTGRRTRVVVVGNGMVGARFAQDLVAEVGATHDALDVTVLGTEEYAPYNRVLLSEVVAGRVDVAGIDLPAMASGTLIENLGIEIVELRDDALVGRMPVDHRTVQPAGVLHGGASVALAETLASWAGYLAVDRDRFHVVGMEINANHIRPVRDGWVYGTAKAESIGRTTQVWTIRVTDEADRLVCLSRITLAVIPANRG